MKDRVYIPPLPATVDELQERITAAVNSVTPDMLQRVWSEVDYRIDVCRVTRGGTLSVCDTTWNCMSLCNRSHQFCKNIPVSFDFVTTWNQGVFLCSPCISHSCDYSTGHLVDVFLKPPSHQIYISLHLCLWTPPFFLLMAPSELDLSVEWSLGSPLKSYCGPLIFRDSAVAP